MISERNFLLLLLGACGIDGIPSTLGVLFNLCHTSAPRRATCCRNFWQLEKKIQMKLELLFFVTGGL